MEMTKSNDKNRLRRDWSKEAIALALEGEWQRATEVNQAILALYPDDVDAMNRLGKAFMELSEYQRAREVLVEVARKAPYNTIAKKNLARLEQLESAPATGRLVRKSGTASKLFIAESGKSGTTVLQNPASSSVVAGIAPGDPVNLMVQNQSILAYAGDDVYLGRVDSRLAGRLSRLMGGGNRYEAAVIGTNDWGITIIIREAFRHPSLHNISSFPTNSRGEHRAYSNQGLIRYLEEDDPEEGVDESALDYVGVADTDPEWDE